MTSARSDTCVLCRMAAETDAEDSHVLYRGQAAYVVLNRFPYNSGHLMVVPTRHLSDFTALGGEELAEIMDLAQGCIEALSQCLRPDGVNLGMNLGQAAGAGIDDHLHLHVIPRWAGDTNFISTVGETRVVPQSLDACAEQVGPVLRKIMATRTGASATECAEA